MTPDPSPPDCGQTLRELELFLDGELPAEDHKHVLAHINECMECFHAFDFHAELKALIAEKCHREPMPDGLLERIERCCSPDAAASPASPPDPI